jgi:pantoate--beta-alanine ligase
MAMLIVKSIASMQRLVGKWRRAGALIGLVPTMGYLHKGHLSLLREARKRLGKGGRLVVSIYVNPTQFAPDEDFVRYPRDLKRDLKLLRERGADAAFTPGDPEMYPAGAMRVQGPTAQRATLSDFGTKVIEENLSRTLEGISRPGHFRGVTTVVAKLFNIVQPDLAVFGQKDFQQAAIIERMVRDLNFPVKIIVAPTVREPDGLAMSSRNKYLEGDLRRQATVLWRAIEAARMAVKKSKAVSAAKLKADVKALVETEPDARLDYVDFLEPKTLAPVQKVSRGAHMLLAACIGKTRLIDNGRL